MQRNKFVVRTEFTDILVTQQDEYQLSRHNSKQHVNLQGRHQNLDLQSLLYPHLVSYDCSSSLLLALAACTIEESVPFFSP